MNASYLLAHRSSIAVAVLHLSGVAMIISGASGCARRAIVVQAPPATVIQSPAPAAPAATVIQTPPAAAPTPTGRDVIFVKEAPPPPREEPTPPPPSPEYRWIPGYWTSRDGRQEWVSGRWEVPPRTSATWVAPRWERRGDGYVFIEGYWR